MRMNENTYISLLSRLLSALPPDERQEILDDYRCHFRDGRAVGESDSEIIARLGAPEDVAAGYFESVPPPPPPPTPPPPPPPPGVPGWAKALICGAGVFWLVIALGFTARVFIASRSHPRIDYNSLGPQATAVEVIVPSYEIIGQTDAFLDALRKDIEQAVQDSAYTQVIRDSQYVQLDEYAQDWSNWIPGGAAAQMEPVNSSSSFAGEIYGISVSGLYNMSCSVSRADIETVTVLANGEIPSGHWLDIDLYGKTVEVRYKNEGMDVNIPYGSRLHIYITVPLWWQGELDISTISGEITIDPSCSMLSLNVQSISGSIRVSGSHGGVVATSVSGGIFISGGCDTLNTSNVSGNTKAHLSRQPGAMDMSSVSGGLGLFMDGEYIYNWHSVSSTLFNNSKGIEGEGGYRFVTVSGDVYLEPYTAN